MKVEYHIETAFSPEFLRAAARLYRIAGWVAEEDACDFLGAALGNSCAVCSAVADGRLIGMGRALGDGVSDAYIQDVVVDPEFRGRGVGSSIVRTLVRELRRRGTDWLALVGAPGTEGFYRSLGFYSPEGYTFWRIPDDAGGGGG